MRRWIMAHKIEMPRGMMGRELMVRRLSSRAGRPSVGAIREV
jgi:hypothetical protein